MHSEPQNTATQPPLEAAPAEVLPPGVRRSKQHCHRFKPYEISLYAGSKRVGREYFALPEEAAKALEKHRKKQRKHGTGVFTYDPAEHAEFTEAKALARGADLRVVARFYAERHKPGAGAVPNVRAASQAYRATKEKLGRSDDHTATIKTRLEEFCTVFGERPIDTITTNEILDWILDLKKSDGTPIAPRTKFNFYTELYGLFAFAKKRKWVQANPVEDIDRDADLPTVPRGLKGKLTLPQGEAFLRLFEAGGRVKWIHWALVQYFVGVRDAEAERMHGEWIDPIGRRIVLPGWHLEGNEVAPITKTRDDWVIDDVPDAFWVWIARYPPPNGRLAGPSSNAWKRIKRDLKAAAGLEKWPSNALRHGFANYHLSAYRDAPRTAIILRHQSTKKLWASYVSTLVPREDGLSYLSVTPSRKI